MILLNANIIYEKVYGGTESSMKRRAYLTMIAVTAILAVMLCACAGTKKVANEETDSMGAAGKSLYEQGLDVVALMAEMVQSEDYVSMMTSSAEMRELAAVVGDGDYTTPAKVYKIAIPEDYLNSMLTGVLEGEQDTLNGMSDSLYDYLNKRMTVGIANQINAQSGINALALSSALTAAKTFVSDELQKDSIYLYTFDNGYPVLLSFSMGEGGAVTATGNYLIDTKWTFESVEDVKEMLSEMYFVTEDIAEEK